MDKLSDRCQVLHHSSVHGFDIFLVDTKYGHIIHADAIAFDTIIRSQHGNFLFNMRSKTVSCFYDDSKADVIQSVVLPLTNSKKMEKRLLLSQLQFQLLSQLLLQLRLLLLLLSHL